MRTFSYSRRGFTIIELLMVIAIIGILASIALAALNASRTKAENAAYIAQLDQYQKAFELYRADNGTYPPSGSISSATGTNACLGDQYSGDNCWHNTGTGVNESTILNTALSPYMPSLPIAGYEDPDRTYQGAMYRHAPYARGYEILYMLKGANQNCGPGVTINPTDSGTTRCQIYK